MTSGLIFYICSNFITFWDILGNFTFDPFKTGFMFGLIPHEPLVVQKLTIPHMKASILSNFEPEEQGHGINTGAPRLFPIKSILSRKSGPIEGAYTVI